MAGFTKLFSSITESSIWMASDKTLRVWVAMLARADSDGIVEGSPPAFAHLCRMSLEDFLACESELMAPDPYSRTPDHEGRRLEKVQGGWRVLNYIAYREKEQGKAGSRAPYMRDYRRKRSQHDVTRNNGAVTPVTRSTEAEAEAEAEVPQSPQAPDVELPHGFPRTTEEAELHADFAGCPREFARTEWLRAHGRGGRDSKDVPVRNWRTFLASAWQSSRGRQFEAQDRGKTSTGFRERDALVKEAETLKAERTRLVGKRPYQREPDHDQRLAAIDARVAEIDRMLA